MKPSDTPEHFGDFKVEEYIKTGAFGHVFRVSKENKEFAVKWLKESPPEHGLERLKNEIWALRQLDHASIPRFYDEGIELGRPWFAMTYVRGDDVAKQLDRKAKEHAFFGEMEVLRVLIDTLSALTHMHERGILHRDVKHDNIVTDASVTRCSLLDVGCCTSKERPYSADTFWNIGASRFSPPAKLLHPKETRENHDVFAAGVVSYLMLTHQYPWSVEGEKDSGHLRHLMESEAATDIQQLNNTVSPELQRLVEELIIRDDNLRPSAKQALASAEALRDRFAQKVAPSAIRSNSITLPRVIRDPLHGDIRLTEFEWSIIKTPEFQRLRWLGQLGFTHLLFPGATHSRFEHCFGSLFIADRILRLMKDVEGTISGSHATDNELILLSRCYALVHDVMHISFGHTLEDELGFFIRHDQNTQRVQRLFLSPKSAIGQILRTQGYGEKVLAHFDPDSTIKKRTFVEELVSSSSGADVLDYVNRDSFHCGLDERIDSAIFRRFKFGPSEQGGQFLCQSFGRHGRRLDAKFALEDLRMARFALYMKVYTHPVKITASAMLGKALSLALEKDAKEMFKEEKLEWMGDMELLLRLRDASASKTARDIVSAIFTRDLYQPIYRARMLSPENPSVEIYRHRQSALADKGVFDPKLRTTEIEREMAKAAKTDESNIIIYCAPKAPGYAKATFRVLTDKGVTGPDERLEAELLRRHSALWVAYAFAPKNLAAPVQQRLVSSLVNLFERPNELPIKPSEPKLPLWEMHR
jgi:HD superfamily phosphohydrolase